MSNTLPPEYCGFVTIWRKVCVIFNNFYGSAMSHLEPWTLICYWLRRLLLNILWVVWDNLEILCLLSSYHNICSLPPVRTTIGKIKTVFEVFCIILYYSVLFCIAKLSLNFNPNFNFGWGWSYSSIHLPTHSPSPTPTPTPNQTNPPFCAGSC